MADMPPPPGTRATCRLARERPHIHVEHVPPASFETYAIHRPSGENTGNPLFAGRAQEHRGLAGRPPAGLVALHRQDHQIDCRSRRDCSMNTRNLPFGCHEGPLVLTAIGQPRDVAGTVGVHPIQIAEAGLARSDANTICRPSGVQTGFILARVERQLRQRVPLPLVHPDVALPAIGDVECELLAVRREPRIRPVGFRRAEHRRLAVACHPVNRRSRSSRRAWHVHERAVQEKATCAPPETSS